MFYLIERLFFFLFVFSILRSVFQFVFRVRRAAQGPKPQPQGPTRPSGQTSTLLHQDPVCGTYVAAETSLKRIFDGKVVHFCSPECRDRYHS